MDDENDANESWVGVISRRKGQQKIYRHSSSCAKEGLLSEALAKAGKGEKAS